MFQLTKEKNMKWNEQKKNGEDYRIINCVFREETFRKTCIVYCRPSLVHQRGIEFLR